MKIHRSEVLHLEGSVIAIGAFDGIHKGHQKVIEHTVEQSRYLGVPSVIYTFDTPPKAYFQGAQILSHQKDKLERLRFLGVNHTVIATFNEEYLKRSAGAFIKELSFMKPFHIIVGEDFRFGHKRSGDINLLRKYYHVNAISPVCCSKGERISSTRIRDLILEGKDEQAIPLLP